MHNCFYFPKNEIRCGIGVVGFVLVNNCMSHHNHFTIGRDVNGSSMTLEYISVLSTNIHFFCVCCE